MWFHPLQEDEGDVQSLGLGFVYEKFDEATGVLLLDAPGNIETTCANVLTCGC